MAHLHPTTSSGGTSNSHPSFKRPSFKQRLATAFRPKPSSSSSSNKLVKNPRPTNPGTSTLPQKPLAHGAIYRPTTLNPRDEQTGEYAFPHRLTDDTDLLHGLGYRESNSSLESLARDIPPEDDGRKPGEETISSLPSDIWILISTYLTPLTAANLSITSKTLSVRLAGRPWKQLNTPQNKPAKIDFLLQFDSKLPLHLFCFSCAIYHKRLSPGTERLRSTTAQLSHPVYHCPASTSLKPIPNLRTRLTPGNSLPFSFIQLVTRAKKYGPQFGIPLSALERRWKDPESAWTHQSRYFIHKTHLLLRITSQTFAAPNLPPSAQRYLLYSREDYTPYFSICAHWRDGLLTKICKCALSHIPERRESITEQLAKGPKVKLPKAHTTAIVSLCGFCRPMRRCTDCPTEYLVELKLAEDRSEGRFKQVLVVTRWSDLGDGGRVDGEEWMAVNGADGPSSSPLDTDFQNDDENQDDWSDDEEDAGLGAFGERYTGKISPVTEKPTYDSFKKMGRRAISGIFESQSGVAMPGQRLLSLNPSGRRRGEDGGGWY